MTYSTVWLLPCIFALYVLLSSFWAKDSLAALVSGGLLALFLVCTRLVFVGIMIEESAPVERLGRYFVAAVAAGALMLAVDVFLQGALHRAVYTMFPVLAPTNMKFMREGEFIGLHAFNRNITLLNMLLWSALSILARNAMDLRTAAAAIGLYLLVGGTTFASDHETSMIAIASSSVVFLVYRFSPRSARILVTAGWIAAFVLVRPAVLLAYQNDMHMATWLPENARARIILWAYTVRQMPNAPILGVGAQTTRASSDSRRHAKTLPGHVHAQSTGAHAHNIYIQTWYELGVVGVGVLLVAGLCVPRWLWQLPRPNQDFAASTFVCVSVICASSFGMWQTWFMATCMLTILMAALAVRWSTARLARPRITGYSAGSIDDLTGEGDRRRR